MIAKGARGTGLHDTVQVLPSSRHTSIEVKEDTKESQLDLSETHWRVGKLGKCARSQITDSDNSPGDRRCQLAGVNKLV